MKNNLTTFISFIFIFSSLIYSQVDTCKCCPEEFTGNAIWLPNVMFEKLFVEDSIKYSLKPEFVDTMASVIRKLNEAWPNIYNGVEGKLAVSITIDGDGLINKLKIIKGLEDKLDSIALEVLKSIKFKPARIDEEKVSSEVVLLFNYRHIVKNDRPPYIVSEIMIDYKPGFVYTYWKIVYKSNLTAYYEKVYPDTIEKFSGQLDEYYYNRLNDLIHSICFFSMNDSYGSQYTDEGTVTLTVSQGNNKKAIRLRRNLPIGLWSLEQLIFYLRDDIIKWQPIN